MPGLGLAPEPLSRARRSRRARARFDFFAGHPVFYEALGVEHRAENLADVTSRAQERRGHFVNESVGRAIRNELLSELGRDETRRGWMAGEKRDDGIALVDSTPTFPTSFDALAEKGLDSIIVGVLVKEEAPFIRERAEHLRHPRATHALFQSFLDAHGLRADDGPPGEEREPLRRHLSVRSRHPHPKCGAP